MFSVKSLLEKYYPSILEKKWLSKLFTSFLAIILKEKKIDQFLRENSHLQGYDFLEAVLHYFKFSFTFKDAEKENIPATGKVIIIANHPIGSLDGLALIKLVRDIRPDVKVLANSVLSELEPLSSLFFPVHNLVGKFSTTEIKDILLYLNDGGAVIVFPAGEVSRLKWLTIRDSAWRKGFLNMAFMTHSPVLPLHVKGRLSPFFYFVSFLYQPLSTLLLVNEMFKQRNKVIHITIGQKISLDNPSFNTIDRNRLTKLFKKHVYLIGQGKNGIFKGTAPIIHPIKRQELVEALKSCELIGKTPGNKKIYLMEETIDKSILREIGRLREISFRAVEEGTGNRYDLDLYDNYYSHIFIWDENDLEIAGAYRLIKSGQAIPEKSIDSLYSSTLFEYLEGMNPYLENGLELGRSFVQPKYWGKHSLDYLWYGIGAYINKNPDIRYLFGPVSMSNHFPELAKDLLYLYFSHYYKSEEGLVESRLPYSPSHENESYFRSTFKLDDIKADFAQMKHLFSNLGVKVPTLYKQYSELCTEGGVRFVDFNIDPLFSDCVDAMILVDLNYLKKKKRKRYLNEEEIPDEIVVDAY